MTDSLRSHISLKQPSIEPERILYHLSRSPLLVKYLRGVIIDETLERWEKSPEFESIVCRVEPSMLAKNRQQILFKLYKQAEFGRFVRSRFLAYKSQLDRVLFSTIQVKNLRLAQELHCRVKEQKQSITRLAINHSDSHTAKRGGVVGPISTVKLHPLIQHYLTGLQTKQLSPIFKLDEHYIFLQLDRWLPVQLNPQVEQQLLDEIFPIDLIPVLKISLALLMSRSNRSQQA
jgi:hypothetical protein